MTEAYDYLQTLGGEDSIWFKISPFIDARTSVNGALFDREMPFHPDIVFDAVKSYTDVTNQRAERCQISRRQYS